MVDLENLGKVSFPRKVINLDYTFELIERHSFSVASFQNYRASVYIRWFSKEKYQRQFNCFQT